MCGTGDNDDRMIKHLSVDDNDDENEIDKNINFPFSVLPIVLLATVEKGRNVIVILSG